MDARATEIVAFWRNAGSDRWFSSDEGFDLTFDKRFRDLHFAAARRELEGWLDEPESALALIILLDQFPRNCFRGTAHMYATDPLARHYAKRAIAAGDHLAIDAELRVFMIMPLVHSEALADHDEAVWLAGDLDDKNRKSIAGHRDIIARFGRFPHRNRLLGRDTTANEAGFLSDGGFSG